MGKQPDETIKEEKNVKEKEIKEIEVETKEPTEETLDHLDNDSK